MQVLADACGTDRTFSMAYILFKSGLNPSLPGLQFTFSLQATFFKNSEMQVIFFYPLLPIKFYNGKMFACT